MFDLIQGTPKPKPSMSELYYKAYKRKLNTMAEVAESDHELEPDATGLMSLVFLGTKYFIGLSDENEPKDMKSMLTNFRLAESIKLLMACLTPRQFMNVFPITKTYDGAKYGWKDYFYVMEKVGSLNQDAPIGEGIDDFLWDYQNEDTETFGVDIFCLISNIMRAEGKTGPMERFCADLEIPLYYLDSKDKHITGPIQVKKVEDCYCYDNSEAKTMPLKKTMPKYLKAVD